MVLEGEEGEDSFDLASTEECNNDNGDLGQSAVVLGIILAGAEAVFLRSTH